MLCLRMSPEEKPMVLSIGGWPSSNEEARAYFHVSVTVVHGKLKLKLSGLGIGWLDGWMAAHRKFKTLLSVFGFTRSDED